MNELKIEKHWFMWVAPCIWSIILCWTIIAPVFYLVYTFCRWKFDIIKIEENCLYVKTGIIFLNKKAIPLKQISYISVKSDIVSERLGFGTLEVQSSAFAQNIYFKYVKNANQIVQYVNENKN